jgi:NADH-quinone oxidoreductase subunit F
VDIRHLEAPPTDDERAAIDALLGPDPGEVSVSFREAQRRRRLLLPALHALQDRVGRVSEGGLGYVCRRLHVPPAEAYGVASFYALYVMDERPPVLAHVCDDVACRLRGGDRVADELERGPLPAGTGVERSPCLGLCERAPAALLLVPGAPPTQVLWGPVDAGSVREALQQGAAPPRAPAVPHQPREALHLLRRVGTVDPTSLDAYRAAGGFSALRQALELGPAGVIRLVTESGLVGRGGAAFPTGRKWEAVARNPARPHHLVCNADESEPGTFKDRVLLEDDPFAVIEGIAVAAYAIGCEEAVIYLRGEYPLARERLANAIAQCRARGLLGPDVLGRGVRLEVHIFRGAGAYICGEETALLNSLEGLRGEPRQKPPFPSDVGLFGEPTAVNNVETLCNVLDILVDGPAAWAARGGPGSPGTRLFCVAGDVRQPGVYEVPLGTTLRELIALCGGTERPLKAVLLGGAAGTFVRPDQLDLKLNFEDTRRTGTTLGSGAVVVLDERAEMHSFLKRIARFFRDESCGQCVPCRVGTVRMEEWLTRQRSGQALGSPADEEARLRDLGQVMRDASICGLGQTAASAIESAARLGLIERGTP